MIQLSYFFYLRDARNGKGEKLISYRYFLALYELYPNECFNLVKSNIFKTAGYWKDIYLIWGEINKLNISENLRYKKYNRLICEFRKKYS